MGKIIAKGSEYKRLLEHVWGREGSLINIDDIGLVSSTTPRELNVTHFEEFNNAIKEHFNLSDSKYNEIILDEFNKQFNSILYLQIQSDFNDYFDYNNNSNSLSEESIILYTLNPFGIITEIKEWNHFYDIKFSRFIESICGSKKIFFSEDDTIRQLYKIYFYSYTQLTLCNVDKIDTTYCIDQYLEALDIESDKYEDLILEDIYNFEKLFEALSCKNSKTYDAICFAWFVIATISVGRYADSKTKKLKQQQIDLTKIIQLEIRRIIGDKIQNNAKKRTHNITQSEARLEAQLEAQLEPHAEARSEAQTQEMQDVIDDEIITNIKTRIKECYDNQISNIYGYDNKDGIKEELLSEISIRDNQQFKDINFNCLYDLRETYNTYFPGKDLRLLLAGPVYSGRETQLLYFWKTSLENSCELVFFIPTNEIYDERPFDYIFTTYLSGIYGKSTERPTDIFKNFVREYGTKYKITIVLSDYDAINPDIKEQFDQVFINPITALNNTDIIIRLRTVRPVWSMVYLNTKAEGVHKNTVVRILKKHKIDAYDNQTILSFYKSPWALKLLMDNIIDASDSSSSDSVKSLTQGILIKRSISKMEEKLSLGEKERAILAYAVHILLPQIEIMEIKDKNTILDSIGEIIEETITKIKSSECYAIEDYYDDDLSKTKLYKMFIKKPLIDKLGLLKEADIQGETKLLWQSSSSTLGNYFYANGLKNLATNDMKDDFIRCIMSNINLVIPLDTPTKIDKADTQQIVKVYDRLEYFINLIDEEKSKNRSSANKTYINLTEELTDKYPEQIAYTYISLAMINEFWGNEDEKFKYANKALAIFNAYNDIIDDPFYKAKYLNKMGYFIVKAPVQEMNPIDIFNDAVALIENNEDFMSQHELSRIYGNMGAHFLHNKEYDDAMKWHQESLETKNKCEDLYENEKQRKMLKESLRRSMICIATDYYYLEEYDESIKYNEKSIVIGNENNLPLTYEGYIRKIGSTIAYYNSKKGLWKRKNAKELLDTLKFVLIELDPKSKKEQNYIYDHTQKILEAIKPLIAPGDNYYKELKELGESIESTINKNTYQNQTKIAEIFEEDNANE